MPVQKYVTWRARIGFLQFACDAEFADQLEQCVGALKTLRPRLEKQPILFDRVNQTAGTVG